MTSQSPTDSTTVSTLSLSLRSICRCLQGCNLHVLWCKQQVQSYATNAHRTYLPQGAVKRHAGGNWVRKLGGLVSVGDACRCLFPPIVAIESEALDTGWVGVECWDLLADGHPPDHVCHTGIDGEGLVTPWLRVVRRRGVEARIVKSGISWGPKGERYHESKHLFLSSTKLCSLSEFLRVSVKSIVSHIQDGADRQTNVQWHDL